MIFNIRPATEVDILAVRDLLVRTWHATYDAVFGVEKVTEITSKWHSEARLSQGLTHGLFLIAERNGSIIGTLSASQAADTTVALHRLYVSPDAQRQGIGRALYQAMCVHFAKAQRITLEVEPRNVGAIDFYKTLGFVASGSGNACGGDATAAVAHLNMEKRFS